MLNEILSQSYEGPFRSESGKNNKIITAENDVRLRIAGGFENCSADRIKAFAGLVDYAKDGLWVNYFLADGKSNPYASSVLGNLRHWLDEDPEIVDLVKKVPLLNREELCRK
jgi:hypothetical protein